MNNDEAWIQLDSDLHIVEKVKNDGSYIIKAIDIKRYREPRLMVKFDNSSQLPKIFRDNGLSILPISRGEYIISDFETFETIHNSSKINVKEFPIPHNIESIDFSDISSEAIAISCAYVTKILSDFTDEENLLPTVSGRMGSDCFQYHILRRSTSGSSMLINVNNAQIEIDGGYEGDNSLIIIEAKNALCSEFIIRQLYYPLRKWKPKIKKNVRTVFMEYSNGIFQLREYSFADINNYNSLNLCKESTYRLVDPSVPITTELLYKLLTSVKINPEPEGIPFPQADSFERVVNLGELLWRKDEEHFTKDVLLRDMEFTGKESFTTRQVDYYTNAAIYIGIVTKITTDHDWNEFILTEEGKRVFGEPNIAKRQIMLISLIISHEVFSVALKESLDSAEVINNDRIVEIMKNSSIANMQTESMFHRRASTVSGWIRWILSHINE